jgi:acetolactate synthase-1/2/3 large subunit
MMLANFPVYEPRTFLHPSGFIALGYGLPAALGAKAAYPHRQVVAVAGDGGFLMTAQELACAVQHKLNVVAIVINDNCLSAMKGIQNRSYGGRHIAVDLVNPDFVKFAESFGALGLRISGVEQFEETLSAALHADQPGVMEIRAPETAM